MEKAYQKFRHGEIVDWESIGAKADRFNCTNSQQWLTEVRQNLTVEIDANQQLMQAAELIDKDNSFKSQQKKKKKK